MEPAAASGAPVQMRMRAPPARDGWKAVQRRCVGMENVKMIPLHHLSLEDKGRKNNITGIIGRCSLHFYQEWRAPMWLYSKRGFSSLTWPPVLMRSDRGDEADLLHGAGSRFALAAMTDDYRDLQKVASR